MSDVKDFQDFRTWIVELEEGVWRAPWSGDPGRTLRKSNARQYRTERGANIGLGLARKWRPFPSARVLARVDDAIGQLYFVQDARSTVGNCLSWWGPDAKGYTCNIDQAGRYHATDQHWRDTDILWPVEYVLDHSVRHFRSDLCGIGNPAAPATRLASRPDSHAHVSEVCEAVR